MSWFQSFGFAGSLGTIAGNWFSGFQQDYEIHAGFHFHCCIGSVERIRISFGFFFRIWILLLFLNCLFCLPIAIGIAFYGIGRIDWIWFWFSRIMRYVKNLKEIKKKLTDIEFLVFLSWILETLGFIWIFG